MQILCAVLRLNSDGVAGFFVVVILFVASPFNFKGFYFIGHIPFGKTMVYKQEAHGGESSKRKRTQKQTCHFFLNRYIGKNRTKGAYTNERQVEPVWYQRLFVYDGKENP